MANILVPLVGVVLLLILYGCTGSKPGSTPAETPSFSTSTTAPNPEETIITHDALSGQAGAYYLVFQDLYASDTGLNDHTDYLALDLSGVTSSETAGIRSLFQEFCDENKLTLLLDTYEGLSQKGYIKDMFFADGMLVSFKDQEASDIKIVTEAKKWRSGTGAIGATYVVTFIEDAWEITDISETWIS